MPVLKVLTLGIIGAALLAGPGRAEPVFEPPQGCKLDMTVQIRSCQVANHYSCAGDPAGDRRISYSDGDGEYFISHIDRETRWVESLDVAGGITDRLDAAGSRKNASFSRLLAMGRDDFDFVTRSTAGETRRYIGYDRLTGQTVTIDKVPLERTEFELRIEDGAGNPIAVRRGKQYISRDMRLFFSDAESFENSYGDKASINEPPVTFAFPGDKDFGATKPQFDCDTLMTRLSPSYDHPTLSEEAL